MPKKTTQGIKTERIIRQKRTAVMRMLFISAWDCVKYGYLNICSKYMNIKSEYMKNMNMKKFNKYQ